MIGGLTMNEERLKELKEEKFSNWEENGKSCVGCIFAYGDNPMENDPSKCSCGVYKYPATKPDKVFIDGGACKYFREK